MSYTVNSSKIISVAGSVRASYPASEYGGTLDVSYSEDVLVNLNITVQTDPFDESVNNANNSIDGLTSSVVAMNAANCAAIASNSKKISSKIIDGFYNLIQSDITSKMSEASSIMKSKHALMLKNSDDVKNKYERMQSDFLREQAKYSQVFADLDSELERRIAEIDRPAFNLARKARDKVVITPYFADVAATADKLTTVRENGKIAAAGMREKVGTVLSGLSRSLGSNLKYRRTMGDILWNKTSDEKQQEYIPVAYFVSENVSDTGSKCSCFVSEYADNQQISAAVTSYVNEKSSAAKEIPDEEMKLIEQAFASMVQDEYSAESNRDEYHERVFNEIFRMWKSGISELKQL